MVEVVGRHLVLLSGQTKLPGAARQARRRTPPGGALVEWRRGVADTVNAALGTTQDATNAAGVPNYPGQLAHDIRFVVTLAKERRASSAFAGLSISGSRILWGW